MAQSELLRLKRIEVDGLFGLYDHRIDLNLTDRATLLHGANGVGKTSILRMTHALLHGDLRHFLGIPFKRFMVEFHDCSILGLFEEVDFTKPGNHRLVLYRHSERHSAERHSALVDLSPSVVDTNDQRTPDWFSSSHSCGTTERTWPNANEIYWLGDFLQRTNSRLIEAQRLVGQSGFVSDRNEATSTVLECSSDFQKRLEETVAAYGRRAHALDQSLLQRLISTSQSSASDKLQVEMTHLRQKAAEIRGNRNPRRAAP